jgi:hypothetical protein
MARRSSATALHDDQNWKPSTALSLNSGADDRVTLKERVTIRLQPTGMTFADGLARYRGVYLLPASAVLTLPPLA